MTALQLNRLTCLIVDDDRFLLHTLSLQLQQLGVKQILKAENAQDAITIITTNDIDIVISDLNMPQMDGIQLLRHIASLKIELGIILVSGEDQRLLESVENLAVQYHLRILGSIAKPVGNEALESVLNRHENSQQPSAQGPAILVFADELQAAILAGQLQVHYQPQVDVKTRKLLGVEALARWHHNDKGFIPPGIFISIAEKYGMIQQLTESVLSQSIRECSQWQKAGLDISLSVNFSAQGLSNLQIPELLGSSLIGTNLRPSQLTLEITESSLPRDACTALEILTRARLKGFGLSIDDFGTGFSSLDQLRRIPFNELKIDRSFVHNAGENKVAQAILESSIALAKRLGIPCVAEGVEDQADWDMVEKLGCDIVQGYFIAKPMAATEVLRWAEEYQRNGSS